MFDYETMLYKALLQPGYLNSSSGPRNILHAFKEKPDYDEDKDQLEEKQEAETGEQETTPIRFFKSR